MTAEHENRREFFRINDRIELQARKLEDDEKVQLDLFHRKRCILCDTANALIEAKLQPPKTLKLIGRRYPEIIDYIQHLEEKIAEQDEC